MYPNKKKAKWHVPTHLVKLPRLLQICVSIFHVLAIKNGKKDVKLVAKSSIILMNVSDLLGEICGFVIAWLSVVCHHISYVGVHLM